MTYRQTGYWLASLLFLTAGCISSRFQPLQPSISVPTTDSVTIFLLERDLPATFDRLGTVSFRMNQSGFGIHQQVVDALQKVGRQKGANGAYRISHGTYEKVGIVTYLLIHYAN